MNPKQINAAIVEHVKRAYDEGRVTREYFMAVSTGANEWVPANGGNEERDHRGVLYVYNPGEGDHGFEYLDIVYPEHPFTGKE